MENIFAVYFKDTTLIQTEYDIHNGGLLQHALYRVWSAWCCSIVEVLKT